MIVLRNVIPADAIKVALDYVKGVPEREREWPSCRLAWEILFLLAYLPQYGIPCEPQIVYHPHDVHENPWAPHIDELPPYANGRRYSAICGVPLTTNSVSTGGVRFHALEDALLNVCFTPLVYPGSVIVFGGDEPHCTGTNYDTDPRLALYFRFLERRDDGNES